MSVRVLAWALRDAPVTNQLDLLVLIAIADHAHDDGSGAYPSVGTIARMARCSDRAVEKALARLQASGVVTVEERPGKTNVYRVLVTPADRSGVTPEPRAATPEPHDTDPRTSRHRPPNPGSGEPLKEPLEPSGEPGVPPSKPRSGKVVSLRSGREPYYDRALR